MEVSAWRSDGTYGIRIGRPNVKRYFPSSVRTIKIKLDGKFYEFALSKTFWKTCPEIRGKQICEWFRKRNLLQWPKGRPPHFNLASRGKGLYKLARL